VIELHREDGLWLVTINNPDKANALSMAMLRDLTRIAKQAQEARALILTGAGKVFSAGADLEEVRAGVTSVTLWEELSAALAALPGLTVAALNGTLAGGATGVALACDLRVSVPEARFFYPVMKRGIVPPAPDAARMTALIGPARTKLILMAGQKLTAQQAYEFGLIDRIVASEELMQTARDLVSDCLNADPEIALNIARMCK